jgi:hypothetical protein
MRPHFVRARVKVHVYPDGSDAIFHGPALHRPLRGERKDHRSETRRLNPLGGETCGRHGQASGLPTPPAGEQKQKKRTYDVLPKPNYLIRYRHGMMAEDAIWRAMWFRPLFALEGHNVGREEVLEAFERRETIASSRNRIAEVAEVLERGSDFAPISRLIVTIVEDGADGPGPSRAETTCGGWPRAPAIVAHVRLSECGVTSNPSRRFISADRRRPFRACGAGRAAGSRVPWQVSRLTKPREASNVVSMAPPAKL